MDDYNNRVTTTYNKLLKQNGQSSPHSIAWISTESQEIRFRVLSQIANLENQIILDVGSGLGDLFGYLQSKQIFYTGIELSQELKLASENKYPGIKITNDDFLSHDFNSQYDFVLCSGAFNSKHPNHQNYVFSAIKKIYELSRKGAAFNLPSKLHELANGNNVFDQETGIEIAYMDPAEVFNFCKSFCDRVTLRHDYLPHDFTIYLYK